MVGRNTMTEILSQLMSNMSCVFLNTRLSMSVVFRRLACLMPVGSLHSNFPNLGRYLPNFTVSD